MGARDRSHGCTDRETVILNRADAGESAESIARDLGITAKYVNSTVRYYNSGLDSDLRARRAAEIANVHHLAAIVATGRRFA